MSEPLTVAETDALMQRVTAGVAPDACAPGFPPLDPRFRVKSGVVFEEDVRGHVCQSPATAAGVIPHQIQHLADENAELRRRVAELEAEVSRLRAMGHSD